MSQVKFRTADGELVRFKTKKKRAKHRTKAYGSPKLRKGTRGSWFVKMLGLYLREDGAWTEHKRSADRFSTRTQAEEARDRFGKDSAKIVRE
jgi:hypothetical protein